MGIVDPRRERADGHFDQFVDHALDVLPRGAAGADQQTGIDGSDVVVVDRPANGRHGSADGDEVSRASLQTHDGVAVRHNLHQAFDIDRLDIAVAIGFDEGRILVVEGDVGLFVLFGRIVGLVELFGKEPFDGVFKFGSDRANDRLSLDRRRDMIDEVNEHRQAGESPEQSHCDRQMGSKERSVSFVLNRTQNDKTVQARAEKQRERDLRDVVIEKRPQQPRAEHRRRLCQGQHGDRKHDARDGDQRPGQRRKRRSRRRAGRGGPVQGRDVLDADGVVQLQHADRQQQRSEQHDRGMNHRLLRSRSHRLSSHVCMGFLESTGAGQKPFDKTVHTITRHSRTATQRRRAAECHGLNHRA